MCRLWLCQFPRSCPSLSPRPYPCRKPWSRSHLCRRPVRSCAGDRTRRPARTSRRNPFPRTALPDGAFFCCRLTPTAIWLATAVCGPHGLRSRNIVAKYYINTCCCGLILSQCYEYSRPPSLPWAGAQVAMQPDLSPQTVPDLICVDCCCKVAGRRLRRARASGPPPAKAAARAASYEAAICRDRFCGNYGCEVAGLRPPRLRPRGSGEAAAVCDRLCRSSLLRRAAGGYSPRMNIAGRLCRSSGIDLRHWATGRVTMRSVGAVMSTATVTRVSGVQAATIASSSWRLR